ncbi:MAG: hypothetical protein JKY19_11585 [Alcanivoracaceae bacterium]|nr:hypothetical protein [Alcanivoracaceae bacterium]
MSNSDSSVPAIRGFQFDSGAIGNLKNSVNLFRGDVNFHQKLIDLTARPGKQELDVSISILYQSNVHDQTQRWNRDSATGILGLGWSLPLESIGMDESAALSPATKSYYYNSNGSKNALIRELGTNPFRFSMPTTYSPVSGSAIGTDIQAQFAANGILIDANAIATSQGSTSWLISDSTYQQQFEIQLANAELAIYDGGESYQLQDYSFWKILYYPEFERWLVVKESGVSYSYGGFNSSANKNKNGYNTSTGNSVQWAVCWSDPNDNSKPIWTGSSSLTADNSQMQYAKSWSLVAITDRFGDQVNYAYNQFGADGTYNTYSNNWRDQTADLIPVVEQQVGVAGLPYTKAHYLTSVVDSFGRKVIFNYGNKAYTQYTGSANAASAREYLDPHRDLTQQVIASDPETWPTANAYQDNYETKYLASIDVQSSLGDALFSIGFSYEAVTASYAEYPNANRLYGDTVKRQLSGVTQYNENGETLLQTEQPELFFQYGALADKNPGALQNITYPDGGIATYSYDELALDVCDRKITITPPAILASSASPRVFYGQDYVVSLWTNAALTKLSMRVYSWLGHWQVWEISDAENGSLIYDDPSGSIHVSGGSGNLLNVKIGESFFVVSFSDGKNVQAYTFSKDTAQPGQWLPYQSTDAVSGKRVNTACNNPSASWPASSTLSFLAGGSWFLALEKTSAQTSNVFRYTNRWAEKTSSQWLRNNWREEQVVSASTDAIYLATSTDCYFMLKYANGTATVSLDWFDPQLNWQVGGSQTIPAFNLPQQDNALAIMGQSFAVFSNQTRNPSNTHVYYDVRVFQWNTDYQFMDLKWDGGSVTTTTAMSLEDRIGKKDAMPSIVPNVVSNSLFGCAGNIFRFDGQSW